MDHCFHVASLCHQGLLDSVIPLRVTMEPCLCQALSCHNCLLGSMSPLCHKDLLGSMRIQKLCIKNEQHLLNTPGNICLHSKEGLKVRMAPTASICNRDPGKGQGQRIQLKDSENLQNHITTESLGFKIKILKFNPCPTTPYGTMCHIHSFFKDNQEG